ncbi:MAG: hypothetical protein ACREP1_09660, partial [Rhodanobacteraceae bacterium]
ARRASGSNKSVTVKRRKREHAAVRVVGRFAVAALVAVVATLVSIQFARIASENVAMAHSLSGVRRDVAVLRERKQEQERDIRRLSDPEGAIPDIHERLHLVGPNEAIIFVKPGHRSTAQ